MNQTLEYMVIMIRIDGTIAKKIYFTNKQKALRYKNALEKEYPYLIVKILEI